jgi:hypothetical protein
LTSPSSNFIPDLGSARILPEDRVIMGNMGGKIDTKRVKLFIVKL